MKYQVKCMHTDEVLFEAFNRYECGEWMEYEELGMGDAWIEEVDYKTCDRCCYDVVDDDGNIMEHICIDDELY
jgi:hypothetical protein